MIHDAKVEVTCDARCCIGSEYIDLEWKYDNYSGDTGYFDSNENDIEDKLKKLGWVVAGEHHFCCKDCYEDSTKEYDEI